jgi:hypothetical protein
MGDDPASTLNEATLMSMTGTMRRRLLAMGGAAAVLAVGLGLAVSNASADDAGRTRFAKACHSVQDAIAWSAFGPALGPFDATPGQGRNLNEMDALGEAKTEVGLGTVPSGKDPANLRQLADDIAIAESQLNRRGFADLSALRADCAAFSPSVVSTTTSAPAH